MSGTTIMPAIPTYLSVNANETQNITQFAKTDTTTQSDIAYFKSAAPSLTSVNALLGNYRALGIVLNAFGMSANINQTGLLRQLLTQDPTSTTSTAHQIANPAYIRFATAMQQFSPPPFSSASNVNAIVTALGTNNYEKSEDTLSPGLANALYFTRNIGSLTSLDQLMSDPKLLAVATTATNMPAAFGTLDYTQQVNLLSAQINMSNFQKPAFVQQFVTKYLALNAENNSTSSDPTGALAILTGSGSSSSILGAMYPNSSSSSDSTNILGALFPSSSSGSDNTNILTLFA
jgi:hypothetical protein